MLLSEKTSHLGLSVEGMRFGFTNYAEPYIRLRAWR